MTSFFSVHDVESVEVSAISQLQGSGSFTLDIKVESKDGCFEFTLFANNREALELTWSD